MPNITANSAKAMFLKGDIHGLTDIFRMILVGDGFIFDETAHHAYADVVADEVANAYGYTTGGIILTGVLLTIDNTNNLAKLSWDYPQWTAEGGSIITSGAILYDDTTDVASGHDYTDAILCYIDFGGTQTIPNGEILRVQDIYFAIT